MAPRNEKTVTLGDLSEEDREALLTQAREEAKHNPRNVEGYQTLSERERVIRDAMDARDHIRGCPVQEGRTLGRVEGFDARRPPNPALGEPERQVAVIRCVECGGTTFYNGKGDKALLSLDEVVERKAEELVGASSPGSSGNDSDL